MYHYKEIVRFEKWHEKENKVNYGAGCSTTIIVCCVALFIVQFAIEQRRNKTSCQEGFDDSIDSN